MREDRVVPWPEVSRMDGRLEFVRLGLCEGANVSALCRRSGISRKTGHKWLARVRGGAADADAAQAGAVVGSGVGAAAVGGVASLLADRPRYPGSSPGPTGADVEARVVALRREQPSWGAGASCAGACRTRACLRPPPSPPSSASLAC